MFDAFLLDRNHKSWCLRPRWADLTWAAGIDKQLINQSCFSSRTVTAEDNVSNRFLRRRFLPWLFLHQNPEVMNPATSARHVFLV
ncbi:MAG: hypothetical protein R3C28_06365 [Pirellulaceae bacterium]